MGRRKLIVDFILVDDNYFPIKASASAEVFAWALVAPVEANAVDDPADRWVATDAEPAVRRADSFSENS